MRTKSLKLYIYKEYNYLVDKYCINSLYIQNKLICNMYITKHFCSLCNADCYALTCLLNKNISKIECYKFVRYQFCCKNKNLYSIEIDRYIIKI